MELDKSFYTSTFEFTQRDFEEALDNMPENLQDSERAELSQNAIDLLDSSINNLEEAISNLEEATE